MSIPITSPMTRLPRAVHAGMAVVVLGYFQWIKGKLDASYAASRHPVDYATGQTTFDGARIKEFYAEMEATGTLDVYRTTQMIDFGFILAMAGMGLVVATLIARIGPEDGWARRIGLLAGLALVAAALCDAVENLWSFVMLADPAGFADWLALPYSGFAVAKFGLVTLGMLGTAVSLLLGLAARAAQSIGIGKAEG